MPRISLLLPVRITEEKFPNFERYFQSILDCADNLEDIEVVVKFDDDQDLLKATSVVENYRRKGLNIKSVISSRGNGYEDMYRFLKECFFECSPFSEVISSQTIDGFYKLKGFDSKILESCERYKDGVFVIHPSGKFSFKDKIKDVNEAVQWVDPFPLWSRKWIEIQGGFGYNALTDGYTALVEYFLFTEFGIDRRIDVSQYKFIEETHGGGFVESSYWQGPRRKAMESHLSSQSILFARQAAKNIALNIGDSSSVGNYRKYLVDSVLVNYDRNLELEQLLNSAKSSSAVITSADSTHKKSAFVRARRKILSAFGLSRKR